MNTIQIIQVTVQICGLLGLVITLGFTYRQLRTMGEQLAIARRGTDAQHILSLLSFMESDELSAARAIVYTTLHRKHFSDWTDEELKAASRVCASYSTAGLIIKSGIVPLTPLLENMEPLVRQTYEILEPFLREMQKPENGGPQYWIGFDWLYSQLEAPDAVAQRIHSHSDRNTNALKKSARGEQLSNTKGLLRHRFF